MLKRHLKTAYNMTPEQYRERWGLAPDYPMVSPELCQAPLVACQEDRPRHQAPRRRARLAAAAHGRRLSASIGQARP